LLVGSVSVVDSIQRGSKRRETIFFDMRISITPYWTTTELATRDMDGAVYLEEKRLRPVPEGGQAYSSYKSGPSRSL